MYTKNKPTFEIYSAKGFTLIELMVVIVIIGLLAAIAIPNFQRYQAKSRQTEAKLMLASVFTAESSFVVEQNAFTSCLASIGVTPDGTNRFYTFGFSNAIAGGATCGNPNAVCNSINFNPVTTCGAPAAGLTHFLATRSSNGLAFPTEATLAGGAAPNNGRVATLIGAGAGNFFTSIAIGNISSNSASPPDGWSMTQAKLLTNYDPRL